MTENAVGTVGARAPGALGRIKWAFAERRNEVMMTGLRWAIALEWMNSAWGKMNNPRFVSGFAATNANFAKNTQFGWYKDFLTGTVIPNSSTWAYLTMYGEMLVGVALLLGLLTNLGLVGSLFFNLNFYLAAGYSGGSTAGVNLMMLSMGGALLFSRGATWFTLDRWLAEHPMRGLASKHPRLTRVFIGRKVVV